MAYLDLAPGSGAPTETAVIAPVPAADTLVSQHRRHLDAAAAKGVPAHVTVLYPFVAPADVDEEVLAELTRAIAPVAAFDCHFAQTRWFGTDVLWLEPQPAGPFRELTAAVWDAFPRHQPYGGVFDNVVPHLTVAETQLADLPTVRAVERAVQPCLPIRTRIDRLLLIAGSGEPSSWSIVRDLPLHQLARISSSSRRRPV